MASPFARRVRGYVLRAKCIGCSPKLARARAALSVQHVRTGKRVSSVSEAMTRLFYFGRVKVKSKFVPGVHACVEISCTRMTHGMMTD